MKLIDGDWNLFVLSAALVVLVATVEVSLHRMGGTKVAGVSLVRLRSWILPRLASRRIWVLAALTAVAAATTALALITPATR